VPLELRAYDRDPNPSFFTDANSGSPKGIQAENAVKGAVAGRFVKATLRKLA
jgi:hypothetical protein